MQVSAAKLVVAVLASHAGSDVSQLPSSLSPGRCGYMPIRATALRLTASPVVSSVEGDRNVGSGVSCDRLTPFLPGQGVMQPNKIL
jgi:hypothetical protein